MQQDHKKQLRVIKQQICAFTTRHGYKFTDGRNYWTKKHLKWLKELPLEGINKETLDSYLLSYETVSDRIEQMNKRIEEIAETDKYREEIAETDKYREAVHKLICLKSVKVLTALAVIVEIGDFTRFVKAKNFTAFLGLVAGELSSSDDQNQTGITKQGNTFLRKLLVECAQSFSRASSARELACFIWGMMTGNIHTVLA